MCADPPNFDENRSWSEDWPGQFGACACRGSGFPPGGQASCEGLTNTSCQDDTIVSTVVGQIRRAANGTLGPPDGSSADRTTPPQRFFIAAGLHKPHMPFYAPPELYALYPDPPAPKPVSPPKSSPYCAWHSCLSRNPSPAAFSDWGNFTDIPNEMTYEQPMEAATAARLRRGYAASVSYTDANVGEILGALGEAGLASSTVVVLLGDQ